MTGGMAVIDDDGEDFTADNPRRKGGLDEDLRGDAKGVWRLLEAQPRPHSGGVLQVRDVLGLRPHRCIGIHIPPPLQAGQGASGTLGTCDRNVRRSRPQLVSRTRLANASNKT